MVFGMLVSINELTYEGLLIDLQKAKDEEKLRACHCIRL